ncbi:MAG: FAD-binding oxidoreductase [Candidatus Heimdallarchaeota archaeon]|nr:FAD-binding oxidoreductase [Candidatus Heimdallarchaeota archaeon]
MKYDTIIIGAGVIGASTAFHLKRLSPKKNILLIDKNNKVAVGNTAKSAALYRNIFSSTTSQLLANSSIGFYESIADKIALKELGYFWMLSRDDYKKSKVGLNKLEEKKDRFEFLSVKDIPKNLKINTSKSDEFSEVDCILYGHRCGSLSAIKLARYYAAQFQKLGGKIQVPVEIQEINLTEKNRFYPSWSDVNIESITDQNGVKYAAEDFIFATGAWTQSLLAPIGIASQIYPQKRQMFTLKIKPDQITRDIKKRIPILILPTGGVYIKPVIQNSMIMVGSANELGNPYQMTDDPPTAEEGYFKNAIEPVLNHYFPQLKDYSIFSKWAGYYAYYWPDKNPVIEKISNIQWVSGTSGSGIMKADAIGRITAARNLDLEEIELFDKTKFQVADLSLKKRNVDAEELII